MNDPAGYVDYYLQRLSGPDGDNAWHSLIEGGIECLPPLMAALDDPRFAAERATILGLFREFRDARAVPVLAAALSDDDTHVWESAIDGLCAFGGADAMSALSEERARCAALKPVLRRKLEWLSEAIEQLQTGKQFQSDMSKS